VIQNVLSKSLIIFKFITRVTRVEINLVDSMYLIQSLLDV